MITVGTVTAAHGVRGLFRVRFYTERAGDLAAYGPVTCDNGSRLQLEVRSLVKGEALCAAETVTSREQAEALRGQALHIDRAALPALQADEIYHADLLGMAVVSSAGQRLGLVKAVHNFGAGDIVEIMPVGGGPSQMLPFYPPFMRAIDEDKRQITLDSPEDGDKP